MERVIERYVKGLCGTKRAVYRFYAGRLIEWEWQELIRPATDGPQYYPIAIWTVTKQWYRARDGEFRHALPPAIAHEFPNALAAYDRIES